MTHQADRFYTIVVIPGDKVYVLFSGGPWHEVLRRDVWAKHIYAAVRYWNNEIDCNWIVQDDLAYSWDIPTVRRDTDIKADM